MFQSLASLGRYIPAAWTLRARHDESDSMGSASDCERWGSMRFYAEAAACADA